MYFEKPKMGAAANFDASLAMALRAACRPSSYVSAVTIVGWRKSLAIGLSLIALGKEQLARRAHATLRRE